MALALGFARPLGWLVLCLLGTFAHAQVSERELSPERIHKLIEASIHGSPVVRPQASERLVGLGDAVREAVLTRLLESDGLEGRDDWFALGADFLRAAAQLAPMGGDASRPGKSPREALWNVIHDPDFPWRAAIVSGLGSSASSEEAPRFEALLRDPLPAVRLASLVGLDHLPAAHALAITSRALDTETDDRVQRGLALLAVRKGNLSAAWRLFRELERNDRFFDQPQGQMARLEAAQFLAAAFLDAPKVDGSLDPKSPEALAARRALAEYLQAKGATEPSLPNPVSELQGEAVFGLELRSCRRGEFFLRWTDQDTLWVGRSAPTVVALPKGTVARLQDAANTMGAAMGKRYLTGEAGCDLEGFHWRAPDSKRSTRYLVTKGPKPVPGLRPAPLQALAHELLATLPAGIQSDPALDHLRERIAAVLQDIGGALDSAESAGAR